MGYIWVAPRSLKRAELGDDPSIGGSRPTWLARVEKDDSKSPVTPGRCVRHVILLCISQRSLLCGKLLYL
jgi:hypothetical protein